MPPLCHQPSMANRTEWRELLNFLKQQAAVAQAQGEPDEETDLKRIEVASHAVLEGFSTDAAVADTAASYADRNELLGLLLSTVKVVEAGGFRDIDYGNIQHGDAWCLAAARTAAAMLADTQQDGPSDSCRPAALEQQLAWLVLFGRCCSYLHKHLQKSQTTGMFLGQGGRLPPLQLGRPGVDWCAGSFIVTPVVISPKGYQAGHH